MLEEVNTLADSATDNYAVGLETQTQHQLHGDLTLAFHGSASEYFKIWIVNLCLTLITLGIFSAWAKVRKKRYIYSHTLLDGTPFQYLAKPVPILKGRLIAAAGFLLYWFSSHFLTALFPFVMALGLVAAPWLLIKSAAFNARYSAYRNMNFYFDASYLDALKVIYVGGIVPAYAAGMVITWKGQILIIGILSLALLISFPFLLKRIKEFIVTHTSFGGISGEFFANGGNFYKIYFFAFLILLGLLFPLLFIAGIISSGLGKDPLGMQYIFVGIIYASYFVVFAYTKSRGGNLVWNNTKIGPIRFKSTLRSRDLLLIYITNAIAIIVSLGMLIPWSALRTIRYRVDHLDLHKEGGLWEFRGSRTGAVEAVGTETFDFFDIDLSL